MSRKSRRKRKQRGNIKDEPAYSPFPREGLVKQYEPFIRKQVGHFCKQYPSLHRDDILYKAVDLATKAEKAFKPELGLDFSTYLRHRLRELHRLHDQQEAEWGVKIYRTAEDLAHEKAEEEGEPTDDVQFGGGGNGIRLLFDLQWWAALLSPFIRYFYHPGPIETARTYKRQEGGIAQSETIDEFTSEMPKAQKVHRLKLGLQLPGGLSGQDVHQRISADLLAVIKQQPPDPFLIGWIKAFIDHVVRRQREADDEARKRLEGDHSPTFYWAARNWIDVKFYKGRRAPRFLPKYLGFVRLDDHYSNDDGHKTSLHDTIAAERAAKRHDEEVKEALEMAAAVRPKLTNKNDVAMLDALEARIRGNASGGLTEIAREIGITKGAASKIAHRLRDRMGGQK